MSEGAQHSKTFVTDCPGMKQLFILLELALQLRVPIMALYGESGVGKTRLAYALHTMTGSPDGYFRRINCSGLPEELLAQIIRTELGVLSFNRGEDCRNEDRNATRTLFLDEISDVPLANQRELACCIRRKISTHDDTQKIPGRLIVSSSWNLGDLAVSGHFSKDLYSCISDFTVSVPPLRLRRQDIPLLSRHFYHLIPHADRLLGFETLAGELESLAGYDWPGNIRELKNFVERRMLQAATHDCGDKTGKT